MCNLEIETKMALTGLYTALNTAVMPILLFIMPVLPAIPLPMWVRGQLRAAI